MTWKHYFTSSIGRKLIMGLTGLFLITFLIVHCSINSMIFFNDGGETFNHWAHFMGTNVIIHIMEIGLFAGLILHIVQGYMLTAQNKKARPISYQVNKANENSKWYSRSMGLLGTLLLLFLILHIYHFWTPSRLGGIANIRPLEETTLLTYNNQQALNLYAEMKLVFENNLWVVIVYILGVISLAWHLMHGFQSAFQSLGINHKRYTPIIKNVGVAFSIIVPLIFALMPLAFYLGWIN
ncbi:MAG: succinate dehydrogenase cytochrome b subunit [Ferruginibacter sp.]|nr:succinate dehydrogenase cytochrome b subunit [Bacteroidota bacterium]MBX2920025.1 succinate dehydrogenase cytochrome b subunit [Ferruginibacter sp.]MCB0710427.1 succinate dehydrogenase cytochrome b subunit [Chitinophagaceae bacterium]MCC7379307.1 succinate dehydrogenase cytochrome b subunit [Chitinophagaceae bacterium]